MDAINGQNFESPEIEPEEDEQDPHWNTSHEAKEFMKKALETQKILQGILERLDITELLECRLVNKEWNLNSSKILQDRKSCHVFIEFYWEPSPPTGCLSSCHDGPPKYKIYFIGRKNIKNILETARRGRSLYSLKLDTSSLTSLTSLIENSTCFPTWSFTFCDADLGHSDVKIFLKTHRLKIQSLSLVSRDPNGEFVKVNQRKSDHLPHDLPVLQNFSWTDWDKDSVLRVMRSSPNLQVTSLPFDSVNYLDEMILVKKVSTVKRLVVSTENIWGSYSENILQFSNAGGKLEILKFETEIGSTCVGDLTELDIKLRNKLRAACITLLDQTKDTLVKLSLGQLCPHFDLKFLPKFENLKKLTLDVMAGGEADSALLPPKINLQEIFPGVEILELRIKTCHSQSREEEDHCCSWESTFPLNETFHGNFWMVRTIEMDPSFCTGEKWLWKFYKNLCPNFNKLVLRNCDKTKLKFCLPKIFTVWTHLEHLELHFGLGGDCRPYLDKLLVGVCCKKTSLTHFIRRSMSDPFGDKSDGIVVESKRVSGPSICDLKELKTIEIWTQHSYKEEDNFPMSQVSLKYMSKLMPDLKVGVYIYKNKYSNIQII